MPSRTTVNISLTPRLNAFLQRHVKSGRYQTTSEVVREALRLMETQEHERATDLKDLRAKLSAAARQADQGELLDGAAVFEELRTDIEKQKVARTTHRKSRAKRQ